MCETCSNEVDVVEDCSLIDDAETGSTKKLGRPDGLVWVHFKKGKFCHPKKDIPVSSPSAEMFFSGLWKPVREHLIPPLAQTLR